MSLYTELKELANESAENIREKSRKYLDNVLEHAVANWKNGNRYQRHIEFTLTSKDGVPSLSEVTKFMNELRIQGFSVQNLSATIETATYRISF